MSWLKSRTARFVEGGLVLLEVAIRFGLVSGAAIAAALGQFILAGILALLAVGVILRFKRGRLTQRK